MKHDSKNILKKYYNLCCNTSVEPFESQQLKLDECYGFKKKKIEYLKNGTKVAAQNYTFLFFDGDEIQLLCHNQFLGFLIQVNQDKYY